jgi:hypothetical protein
MVYTCKDSQSRRGRHQRDRLLERRRPEYDEHIPAHHRPATLQDSQVGS